MKNLNQIGRWLRLAPFLLFALFSQTPQQAELAAKARNLMAAGSYEAAAETYGELSRQMPANAGWKLNRGMALHMAGRDADAVPLLDAAGRAMPQAFPAHALLGTSLMRLGQPAKAIAPLQRAVALQPKDAQGRRMLAEAFLQTGRPRDAVPQLEVLAGLEPGDAGAWFVLGRTNEQAAAQMFGEFAAKFPESREFLEMMAAVRRKQQRLRAADALAKQAEGRVANPAAVAMAKRIDSYNEGARKAFTRLGALPDNPQIHRIKAETLRAQGKHVEAVEEWRAALQFRPGDREVEAELAVSLFAAGAVIEALNTVNRLLVHEPENAPLLLLRGDCLLQQGQPEEALPSLLDAVRRDPKLMPARVSLARALIGAGRGAEAVPHLEMAAPLLDTDGALYMQLGAAYRAAGNREKAVEALKTAQQRRAGAQQ